jgi:hypothetical protein
MHGAVGDILALYISPTHARDLGLDKKAIINLIKSDPLREVISRTRCSGHVQAQKGDRLQCVHLPSAIFYTSYPERPTTRFVAR